MVKKILNKQEETKFKTFIETQLTKKYGQKITVTPTEIVTGLTGNDQIQPALKIHFLIKDSHTMWVENRISEDIHRYSYENKLYLTRIPVIERDLINGDIRYGLTYVKAY